LDDAVQIVGDIGGTNARFAYVRKGSEELLGIEYFQSDEFPLFIDVIRGYLKVVNLAGVDRICLAVAAPIVDDLIDFPNNHWSFHRTELELALGVPLSLINDFDAQALALDTLQDSELHWLGSPRPVGKRTKAVLGPGTGLGVSAMLPGGDIVPSEGGHTAFAPLNDHQQALHTKLRSRFGRISNEQVLSGPGLSNLYWANCKLAGKDCELSAADIYNRASDGDELCLKAISDFWLILGAIAGDVALMMGASAGVYVSGGVASKLLKFLDEAQFREQFDRKGAFSHICRATPLAIVLAAQPGLRGSVVALRNLQGGAR